MLIIISAAGLTFGIISFIVPFKISSNTKTIRFKTNGNFSSRLPIYIDEFLCVYWIQFTSATFN